MFTRSKDFVLPPSDQTHGTPHHLIKHIEFPYYNEATPSRDKIIEELDHYIEVLCKADNYMNKEEPITKGYYAEQPQQHTTDLDINTIDWESFDISKYNTQQQTEQPTTTLDIYTTTTSPAHTTPIHISISSLWNILRLQQICGSQGNMVDLLKSADRDYYQIMDGDTTLVVTKSFDWEDEEDSESVKSFSSREDW